jgi:hypothetical protein
MERLISIPAMNKNDQGLQSQAKCFMLRTKYVRTAGHLYEYLGSLMCLIRVARKLKLAPAPATRAN